MENNKPNNNISTYTMESKPKNIISTHILGNKSEDDKHKETAKGESDDKDNENAPENNLFRKNALKIPTQEEITEQDAEKKTDVTKLILYQAANDLFSTLIFNHDTVHNTILGSLLDSNSNTFLLAYINERKFNEKRGLTTYSWKVSLDDVTGRKMPYYAEAIKSTCVNDGCVYLLDRFQKNVALFPFLTQNKNSIIIFDQKNNQIISQESTAGVNKSINNFFKSYKKLKGVDKEEIEHKKRFKEDGLDNLNDLSEIKEKENEESSMRQGSEEKNENLEIINTDIKHSEGSSIRNIDIEDNTDNRRNRENDTLNLEEGKTVTQQIENMDDRRNEDNIENMNENMDNIDENNMGGGEEHENEENVDNMQNEENEEHMNEENQNEENEEHMNADENQNEGNQNQNEENQNQNEEEHKNNENQGDGWDDDDI